MTNISVAGPIQTSPREPASIQMAGRSPEQPPWQILTTLIGRPKIREEIEAFPAKLAYSETTDCNLKEGQLIYNSL